MAAQVNPGTGTESMPAGPSHARAKLRAAMIAGLVLLVPAIGVRVWWAQGAPERAARLARIDQETARLQQVKDAQDAVAARPQDAAAHGTLGNALQLAGDAQGALAAWRKATQLAPGDLTAWQTLAFGYLAQKRFAAAEETYRSMAERWPKDAGIQQGIATACLHQGRIQESLKAARKAVALEPDQPSHHYALGAAIEEIGMRAAFAAGQTALLEEGRRHLEIAQKGLPNTPDIAYRRARICLLIRRVEEANEALEKEARLTPERTVVWLALAEARMRLGKVDGAIEAARRAVALAPLEPEAPLALGRALLLKSDKASLEEAAQAFTQATKLAPTSAQCFDRLGTALARLERLPESRAAFEKAAELNPTNPYPVQQLSQIYRRMGENELAARAAKSATALSYNERVLRQVQRASAAHPENPRIHLTLAERYRDLGWLIQAEDEYRATLELEPGNARARDGLAGVRRLAAQKSAP